MRIVCRRSKKREKSLLVALILLMGLTLVACGEENREPQGSRFVEAGEVHPLENSTAPEDVSGQTTEILASEQTEKTEAVQESGMSGNDTPEPIDESKFIKEPFEDVLGYDGVKVLNQSTVLPYETAYYSEADGEKVRIAVSWGFQQDDYVVDVDGDGMNELVCNVVYGNGAADTLIYRREGDKILRGMALELLDGEYDNVSFASQRAKYLPEENVVEIYYYRQAVDDQLSQKYEIDFEKITYWEEVDITNFQ